MGYELIATTTYNAIFLRSDFMTYLPEYDRSIQALHVPHMTTEIFQTYEGCFPHHLTPIYVVFLIISPLSISRFMDINCILVSTYPSILLLLASLPLPCTCHNFFHVTYH